VVDVTGSSVLALDETENIEVKVDGGNIVLLGVTTMPEDDGKSVLLMVVNVGDEVEIVWVVNGLDKTGVELVWPILFLEIKVVTTVLCRVLIAIENVSEEIVVKGVAE
jgi:hypothetical protein